MKHNKSAQFKIAKRTYCVAGSSFSYTFTTWIFENMPTREKLLVKKVSNKVPTVFDHRAQ